MHRGLLKPLARRLFTAGCGAPITGALLLAGLPAGHACGQDFPRHGVRLSAGRHWMEPMRNEAHNGPALPYIGWRPGAYGLECAYVERLSPAFSLVGSLSAAQVPHAYAEPTALHYYDPQRFAEGRIKDPGDPFGAVGLALGANGRRAISPRWAFALEGQFGAHWMPEQRWRGRGRHIMTPPDSSFLSLRMVTWRNRGGGLLPFVRLSLSAELSFRNHNRLGVEAFALYSFRRDTYHTEYLFMPGHPSQSTGLLQGGIGHAGLRLFYCLTWGAPKLPGYMRKAQRKEQVGP